MDNKLQIAKEILIKYNQEHLLNFYNELEPDKQQALFNQILNINFDEILHLYKNSFKDDDLSNVQISPINYTIKENIDKMHYTYYISLRRKNYKRKFFCCYYNGWRPRYQTWIQWT